MRKITQKDCDRCSHYKGHCTLEDLDPCTVEKHTNWLGILIILFAIIAIFALWIS